MMEVVSTSEMSVCTNETTWRYIPEGSSLQCDDSMFVVDTVESIHHLHCDELFHRERRPLCICFCEETKSYYIQIAFNRANMAVDSSTQFELGIHACNSIRTRLNIVLEHLRYIQSLCRMTLPQP